MTHDTRVPPSGAHVLASFFAQLPVRNHPSLRSRLPLVREHLHTYLDTEAEHWATPDELVIIGAQRQLDPIDAVMRVTGAEVLAAALPGFCRAAWLLPERGAARTQLWVVTSLRQWLATTHAVADIEAAVLLGRVDDAVRRAHALLDGSPAPG